MTKTLKTRKNAKQSKRTILFDEEDPRFRNKRIADEINFQALCPIIEDMVVVRNLTLPGVSWVYEQSKQRAFRYKPFVFLGLEMFGNDHYISAHEASNLDEDTYFMYPKACTVSRYLATNPNEKFEGIVMDYFGPYNGESRLALSLIAANQNIVPGGYFMVTTQLKHEPEISKSLMARARIINTFTNIEKPKVTYTSSTTREMRKGGKPESVVTMYLHEMQDFGMLPEHVNSVVYNTPYPEGKTGSDPMMQSLFKVVGYKK